MFIQFIEKNGGGPVFGCGSPQNKTAMVQR